MIKFSIIITKSRLHLSQDNDDDHNSQGNDDDGDSDDDDADADDSHDYGDDGKKYMGHGVWMSVLGRRAECLGPAPAMLPM